MNEPLTRTLKLKPCLSAILAGWCATAAASGAGILQFVHPGPAGGAGPVPVIESFSDAQIRLMPTPNGVNISATSDVSWSLSLASTRSKSFGPACYERARRTASAASDRPVLAFEHSADACNPVGGRYRVLEYQTDPADAKRVTKLAVDFYQYCDDLNHAVVGGFRYHSALPLDAEPLAPMFTASGSVYVLGNSEYVTQGDSYSFPIDAFNTSATLDPSGSEILFDSAANAWQLSFAAATKKPLTSGDYESAQKTGYQDSGHPGLDYAMASRACTQISGAFNIETISRDRVDDYPTSFFATFTQSCETTAPAISGVIAYSASFVSGANVDDVIQVEGFDAERSWPLVWQCR
ncbi:MAG TPA: hypothetical protein VLB69_13095 [Rudaea sp.]|nr:hypothetical protein [Rudaea sp.]